MALRLIDRAGGGLQTVRAFTPIGHLDRQITLSAGQELDVNWAPLPSTPAAPRQTVGAGGAVASECLAPVVRVLRGATIYTGIVQSDVIEEDTPFRMRRRLSGIFQAGGVTWVGGDGNQGSGSTWTIDNRTNRPIKWALWVETRAGMPGVFFRSRLINDGGVGLGGHQWPANDSFYDRLWVTITRLSAAPANFTLVQDHVTSSQTDEAANFRQTLNGVTTTARHSGEVQIGGGWLAVKDFWERYPKGIVVNGATVEVDLFPNVTHEFSTSSPFGSGKHLIQGIWAPTHEFAIGPTVEDVRRLLWPPAPLPTVADLSAKWGTLAPVVNDAEPLLAEALARHSAFHHAVYDPAASSDGASVSVIREHRGYWPNPRQCVGPWYGEQRYGCVFKAGNPGQPAMNIYDWPYILWLQAVRHRKVALYTMAEAATRHTLDYDRWKVRRDDGSIKGRTSVAGDSNCQGSFGVWNWEDGNFNSGTRFQHMGPGASSPGATGSHSWSGGDALGYLLTGDPSIRQDALDAAEGWWKVYVDIYGAPLAAGRWDTTRVTTRAMMWTGLQFLNAYRVSGDPVWLDRALFCVRSMVFIEQQPYIRPGREGSTESDWDKYTTGTGDIGGGAIVESGPNSAIYDRGLTVVTFLIYPLDPIMETCEAAKAAGRPVTDIEDYLLRCLNYLRTKAFKGGQVSADGLSRIPWQTSYRTDPDDPISTTHIYATTGGTVSIPDHKNKGGILQYNHFVASLAAFCAERVLRPRGQVAEADAYVGWARVIYRDQFLLVGSGSITIDPAIYVPLTARGNVNLGQTWPATNLAKVVGWYGRDRKSVV